MGVFSGIMAGVSALSGLIGLATSAAQRKKQIEQEAKDSAALKAQADAEAASNGMSTATASAAMAQNAQENKEALQQAEASRRINGGTREGVLALQDNLIKGRAQQASGIVSGHEQNVVQPAKARSMAIQQQHNQNVQEFAAQQQESIGNGISASLDAMGTIAAAAEPANVSEEGATGAQPTKKSRKAGASGTNDEQKATGGAVLNTATGSATIKPAPISTPSYKPATIQDNLNAVVGNHGINESLLTPQQIAMSRRLNRVNKNW